MPEATIHRLDESERGRRCRCSPSCGPTTSTAGTARLRDRLILHYAPLVKYVAGRVGSGLPAHVEQADLVSYGTFGLIDAITRYEPTREVKFESYAMARIRGAIIDELRSTDWIPRSVRMKARQFERTVAELEGRLQRTPDRRRGRRRRWTWTSRRSASSSASCPWSTSSPSTSCSPTTTAAARPGSVDTLQDSTALDPQAMAEHGEARQLLARAVEQLPEREKVVVSLYYFEGLTLADIGRVLGVTESRICQLHTKAVLHLRTKLADIA